MRTNIHSAVEKRLTDLQLVPVVSLPSVDAGLKLAEILLEVGLPVAEITLRTPSGADGIAAIKREYEDILVLAGTVLSLEQAAIARDAGAECIVMPGFQGELVDFCLLQHLMVCPGVATPSEVLSCRAKGLSAIKFFPAEIVGGIAMLKAMAAVFSDIRFMPTGGISVENVADYLALESVFCCGGSWLAPEKMMENGDWQEIQARITAAVDLLNRLRREV